MKLLLSLALSTWMLFAFSGCADLLNSLRDESAAIDREADRDRDSTADSDDPPAYKSKSLRGLSANNVPSVDPSQARGYGRRLASYDDSGGSAEQLPANNAPTPEFRRYRRADFVDRESTENSLWDGQGQNNYLFSNNRQREPGDLVTVDVEKELKREIQYQLWMTLPPEQRKVTKRAPASADGAKPGEKAAAKADAAKGADEKNRDAAEEAAKTNLAAGGKEDDIVRMEVAENLGNGLSRVVGQKRVIYRGVARVVEVTALVNSKDVDDNNRVKSSNFLDMKTQVIQ